MREAIPVHVAVQTICVWPSAVIVPMKQPDTVSGEGLNCQFTFTLLTYQPLFPGVPVTTGLTVTDVPPAALGAARHARPDTRRNSQRFAVVATTPLSSYSPAERHPLA